MLIFFLALTLGFAFEIGKNALSIDSRQNIPIFETKTNRIYIHIAVPEGKKPSKHPA